MLRIIYDDFVLLRIGFPCFCFNFSCYLANLERKKERKGEEVGCGGENERESRCFLSKGLITHFTSVHGGSCRIRNWVGHSSGNFSDLWDHCRGIS